MTHTASCGKATSRICRCGGCAGSRHGWPGALALAEPTMAGPRAVHRQAAEQAWAEATKPGPRSRTRLRPTHKSARAAVNSARGDIEEWLSATMLAPSAPMKDLVGAVGDVVATDILDALSQELGPQNNNEIRAGLAEKHLFCQLLAELACSMQEVRDEIDRAVKQVALSLLSYKVGRKSVRIPRAMANVIADAAAKGVDKVIETVPAARHFDDLLRAVRILAIMTCPAPEKHEAVIRCALIPLGEPVVSQGVQERIRTAMPGWAA